MRRLLALIHLSVLALTFGTSAAIAQECDADEPDSLQISWTTPCENGSWLLDTLTGCRIWDWHPAPEDIVTWSGPCRGGLKQGAGILQWFEHGRPIDRFEGEFDRNRRQGLGRYSWTERDRFEGHYDADLPNGPGTIIIDDVSFAGTWRHGCLAHEDKVIAIGVPLSTCAGTSLRMTESEEL
jgi:hypothetical protein